MKASFKLIAVLLILALNPSLSTLSAQEETAEPAAAEATIEATVEPTVEPTAVPTLETPVEPTAEPTIEATIEVTAEPTVAPTAEPTIEATVEPTAEPTLDPTAEATIEVTAEPTVEVTPVSAPPVFYFADGAAFEVSAGAAIEVAFTVIDEAGAVTITAGQSSGAVSLTTAAPTETSFPFNTTGTLTYTPPADFSGQDSVTLTAVDLAGVPTSAALTFNVIPVEPTLPPMTEMLIRYKPDASEGAIQEMLATLGAVEVDRIPAIGVLRVLVPARQPSEVAAALSSGGISLADAGDIELNGAYQLAVYTPNDPLYAQQWALKTGDGGIAANYAWDASALRGTGIIVAVLDTGVDLTHPEFVGQLVPGWDFVDNDATPEDEFGHGTRVAGIIAAKTANGAGMAGVAHLAKIMPVKVCINDDLDNDCAYFEIAAGIIHAVDRGARIVNLSMSGSESSNTVQAAIQYALARNVVVVAAAGNTGTNVVTYPASYDGVISVAAHNENGNIAGFSTHNNDVTVSAPGVDVLTTMRLSDDPDGFDATFDGTSLAAPHVSGAAALLMSAKIATTPATVRDALICGAQDDTTNPGYDEYFGFGRLKADLSMNWNANSPNCAITQPNDSAQTPTRITRIPFNVTQPVHSRSVTTQAADPEICGVAREQTLWYTFQPSAPGVYQFNTWGSSYPTVIGVFYGTPGALTPVGCTEGEIGTFALEKGVLYSILVGTNGSAVDDQVMQLMVNAAMPANNVDYQENAKSIAYVGTWIRGALRGASGGYTQSTTDTTAAAMFSFRGTNFDYVRTIGPDRGATLVYINGSLVTTVNNRAAITKLNQAQNVAVPGAVPGQWNTVYLMRDETVPGRIDLDRIRTYDYDANTVAARISGKVDDRDARLRYFSVGVGDSWSNVPYTGAFYNTLRQTSVEDASVVFRGRGNAVTIYRMTGPAFADMTVTIDNGTPITVSNTAATTAIRAFTIDGLVPVDHVVEIRKVGAANSIQLDAVQIATLGTLVANRTYNETIVQLAYRGIWTKNVNIAGALSGTTATLEVGSEASFKFAGNDLCIGYQRSNGDMQVFIDGTLVKTITEPGSGFSAWCLDANEHRLMPDTTHYVRLVAQTNPVTLDYVRPQRRSVISAANGVIQENHVAVRYAAPALWLRLGGTAVISSGGYKPQGGYLRQTRNDETALNFYINGTGLILYTTVGARGCWVVNVDGAQYGDPIYMLTSSVYRPIGYGVTGLPPGIHHVEMVADSDCSSVIPGGLGSNFPLEFDAIRALP